MSGHSKWSTIKRKKGVEDAKRSQMFTKASRLLSIAAREGGADQNMNFKLRLMIDKAKEINMPQDSIERAIARGTGKGEGAQLEQVTYEGFGPAGIAVIIEAVTDNKNRTLGEVRNIMSNHGGNLGSEGSVKWMFEQQGAIRIALGPQIKKDELELELIDLGVNDIKEENSILAIFCDPKKLGGLKKSMEQKGIKIKSAEIEMKTKNPVKISDKSTLEKIEKLMEALDEHDDVNEIYSNVED